MKDLSTFEEIEEYYLSQIASIKEQEEDVAARLKQFVTNKEWPLDQRWKLFLESGLGEINLYVYHFPIWETEKWQEWGRNTVEDQIFEHLDKGSRALCYNLDDEIKYLIGMDFELDGPDYERRDEKRVVEFTKNDYDEWREDILKEFLRGFVFDW